MRNNILLIGGCGYIGSYLYNKLSEENIVDSVDIELRGNPNNHKNRKINYKLLNGEQLKVYDSIVWFGGHSSVSASFSDPVGALENNCLNLIKFALQMGENTKFIYASTASLYSKEFPLYPSKETDILGNDFGITPYDVSKYAFDYLAKNYLKQFIGLRMGTVSGWSPNIRKELVFNAMNYSAKTKGHIELMNGSSMRSILYLTDLARFIEMAVKENIETGFYNACSETYTMQGLAERIACYWGNVEIIDRGSSQSYSFQIDNSKFLNVIGHTSSFEYEAGILKEKI